MSSNKSLYTSRKNAGLCVRCGRDNPDFRFALCDGCRRLQLEDKKSKVKLYKAAGLCPRCGSTPEEGRRYCPKCLAWFRERYARRNFTNRYEM